MPTRIRSRRGRDAEARCPDHPGSHSREAPAQFSAALTARVCVTPAVMLALQRTAGNSALAELVSQQRVHT